MRRRTSEEEQEKMGCTSAKQVSAVPSSEEGGQSKSHSNGDLLSGSSLCFPNIFHLLDG